MQDRVEKKGCRIINMLENRRKQSRCSYLMKMYLQICQVKWLLKIAEVPGANQEPLGVLSVETIMLRITSNLLLNRFKCLNC